MKCITFLPIEQGKNWNLKNVAHKNVWILTNDQMGNFETSRIGQKTPVPFKEWLERHMINIAKIINYRSLWHLHMSSVLVAGEIGS